MNKSLPVILLAFIVISVRAVKLPEACENSCSCKYDCNVCTETNVTVLCLKGSHYEMGQHYGGIFGSELNDVIDELKLYFKGRNITWDWVQQDAMEFTKRWSYEYVSFLKGIAASTDFSEQEIYIINGGSPIFGDSYLTRCMYGFVPPSKSETGSAFAVRNFDLDAPFGVISRHLAVTTLIETNLAPTTFVSMVGQIYCQTCWNKNGIFMELNNGMPSGGFQRNYDRQDLLINMLYMMQNSDTFERLSRQLMATTTDFSLIVNIANASTTESFEMGSIPFWGTKQVSIPDEEVFVATNFFQNPDWYDYQKLSWNYSYIPDDDGTWIGVTRHSNMVNLLSKQNQSVSTLKDVMDVPLGMTVEHPENRGGANWWQTVYQVIWDPDTNSVYVRRNKYDSEWTNVELTQYYDGQVGGGGQNMRNYLSVIVLLLLVAIIRNE